MTQIIRLLMYVEAATFFVGSVLHLGIPLFGFTEPIILPATVVEGICGVALLVGAGFYRGGDVRAALIAHAVAIGGVLLGMAALAAGRGPSTPLNTVYHRTILIALLVTGTLVFGARRRVQT